MGVNGASASCKATATLATASACLLDVAAVRQRAWVESPCGGDSCIAQPGLGAQCLAGAPGTGLTLSGHLQFEYLSRNAALTDFDPTPKLEDAVDFFVTVFKCTSADCSQTTLLGMTLTGAGMNNQAPGTWTMELSETIDEASFVYFWPMLFDQSGNPRMAMAKAESDDAIFRSRASTGFGASTPVPRAPGSVGPISGPR